MLSNVAHRLGTPFIASFPSLHPEMAGDDQEQFSQSGFGALTLCEDANHFYVDADVPGMTVEQIELVVDDGKLWIRGTRRPPCRGEKCWRQERFDGHFERVIILADSVDREKIEAELKSGVLSITLSKKAEAKAQRIEISGQPRRVSQSG